MTILTRGLLLLLLCGCGTRSGIVVAQKGESATKLNLDHWLMTHPLEAGKEIAVQEIWRSEASSAHIVQIRTAEKPHIHATHDAVATLIRGYGTFHIGHQQFDVGVGSTITIPRGIRHYFVNTSGGPAVALAVFSPPMLEPDYVEFP